MSGKQFEYGPLARGIHQACVSVTIIFPLISWELFGWWVLMLAFFTFGLRPLLERTGLYKLISHSVVVIDDKSHARFEAKRRQEVDRKARDAKYRGGHRKHPDLPDHW